MMIDKDLPELRRKWKAAQHAWNKDSGPIEKTIQAGEDLYFAATFLIDRLEEIVAQHQ